MKRIIFIFCLVTINTLPASNTVTDTVYNRTFQKEVNFYLKYGTIQETKKVVQKLELLEQKNQEKKAALDFASLQASKDYIAANERITLNTKMLNNKTITHVNLHDQIAAGHQDGCNAWYTFQAHSFNKSLAEQESIEISFKKQALINRKNRLKIRSERRNFTAEQQAFQEYQRQSYLEKTSKIEPSLTEKAQFKKAQENIKPLLNRVIRQSQAAQATKTSSDNLLGQYIAQAQQQSQLTKEKKQRKVACNAQKNHALKALQLIEQQERHQQKKVQIQDCKILQSLAIQKGISQPVIPTQAQRTAQSLKDKEATREQNENILMNHEDKTTILSSTIHHEKQTNQKQISLEKKQTTIADQNNFDTISMLLSRLQSQKHSTFHPNNPDQEREFLGIVLELEEIVDKNPKLFCAQESSDVRSQCIKIISENLKSYRDKLQPIQDSALSELEKQSQRSLEIATFSKSNVLVDGKLINRFLALKEEESNFLELIEQDIQLRAAIITTELLDKKLKNSGTSSQLIKNHLTNISSNSFERSPFLSYREDQKKLQKAHQQNLETDVDSAADITNQNQTQQVEKRPSVYTLHPKVYEKIQAKMFEIASPAQYETEKKQLADFINQEIQFIFPDDNEMMRNIKARVIVARGIKEFEACKTSNSKFSDMASAMANAINHQLNIKQRVVQLNKANPSLSRSDINVLAQLESMVFEAYFANYCSDILESQSAAKKTSSYAKASADRPKK